MTVWTAIAELVLPTGTIRRAFRRVALSRCWREQRRLDRTYDETVRVDRRDLWNEAAV